MAKKKRASFKVKLASRNAHLRRAGMRTIRTIKKLHNNRDAFLYGYGT